MKETKAKARRLLYQETKWLYLHPEYSVPQWYIQLLIRAQYEYMHCSYTDALHDIEQAAAGRFECLGEGEANAD